jgi:hypothetical protein
MKTKLFLSVILGIFLLGCKKEKTPKPDTSYTAEINISSTTKINYVVYGSDTVLVTDGDQRYKVASGSYKWIDNITCKKGVEYTVVCNTSQLATAGKNRIVLFVYDGATGPVINSTSYTDPEVEPTFSATIKFSKN